MKRLTVPVLCRTCGKRLKGTPGVHGFHVSAHTNADKKPCWGTKHTDHKLVAAAEAKSPFTFTGLGGVEPKFPPMEKGLKQQLKNAGRRVQEATTERDRLIRVAVVDNGASLREVGEAVGMSHTAVKFIAHGRPK